MATTIKDVAKRAGVGVGTVSRVLNGEKNVNPATQELVQNAIRELNYIPNRMASRLRKNSSNIIALLVPVIDHPFFAQFAYYAEDEADRFGYSLLLVSSQRRICKESEIIARIRRREVDGALFLTHFEHDPEEMEGCAIVSVDRPLGNGIPYVTSDNYEATKKAVEYLISRGCRNVGYVGTKPLMASEVLRREEAYREVMAEHGMPCRISNDVTLHGEESKVVNEFFEKFPDVDGVFASGYTMAQALYETAVGRGRRIPEEMQIVSYDGAFYQWGNNHSLTCVEQPVEQMARTAVKLLMRKIEGEDAPVRTMLQTTFSVGSSTR